MYHIYLLQCSDGTFYCGSTNDLAKRVHAHNHAKTGARYTKARRPVALVYSEAVPTRGDALAREAAIKRLTRSQKRSLAGLSS